MDCEPRYRLNKAYYTRWHSVIDTDCVCRVLPRLVILFIYYNTCAAAAAAVLLLLFF